MEIEVGSFAQQGLESRVGSNLPAAVNAALVYYVGKLRSGRRPVPYPKFLPGGRGAAGADEFVVRRGAPAIEVGVDESIEAELDREATRQGISPAALAAHAILVFLAELDLIGDPARGVSGGARA